MSHPREKATLRSTIKSQLLSISPADRAQQQSELNHLFHSLHGLAQAQSILLYVTGFPEEFDTSDMIRDTLDVGKTLVLPRVDRVEKRLRLHTVRSIEFDLKRSKNGIPEPIESLPELSPDEIDWLLVPGLAFSNDGHRLGRGGGYYDRLLAEIRDDATTWALIFNEQWCDKVPTEPHDKPVDGAASLSRTIWNPRQSAPSSIHKLNMCPS